MKDNFDLHEWNKKRYLGELGIDQNINKDDEGSSFNITHGGDDPKIGAELESDDNVVGENQSHLEFLAKYLNSMHPELTWEVSFGKRIDAYGSAQDLANFGNKYHGKKFGEYEVFHVDDDDRLDIVRIVKSDSIMRNENLDEASYMYKGYKDKHFDICPAAEGLRDRLLAGEFKDNKWATGTNFEKEVGEWLYQHDVLFQIEKQVLRDKEGEESDVEDAKKAVDRIVNLSRDLGIPAAEISYLKAHIQKIKDIVEYSSLTESTLCKRGQEYIKARKAAGEKSSAYLSGRAVKVCKGDIEFKGKKQKDFKNESLDEYVDNGPEEKSFDVEMEKAGKGIASAIEKELKNKKPQELNEAIITSVIAGVLTGNSLINFISKLAKLLFKKIGFKKGEDIAGKIQHWAHDNEMAFQKPIKRVLSFFIKDTKTLDIVTKGIYAIVVGSMAANYGAEALSSLSKSDWFASSLNALKTLAKSDETIVNAYPAIRALI